MVESISNNVIDLQNVTKQYVKETVLHNVSFNVRPGECVVLVGHNGAGKTSLMKLMLGLTRPTSGRVNVLGDNPANRDAVGRRKALGYLPESVSFYEAMSGREVLEFYASLKGVKKSECDHLLELVNLHKAANRRVGTYSKGMRQRLGLAQAILGNPQLLFLDEPTTGLDPLLRQHFYALIDDLHQAGATSIISSHALSEVEARANRFIIMKSGKLIASGTLDDLYQQANLPVRFKIAVTPGEAVNVAERLGSQVDIQNVNNETINLQCILPEKMPLIRHITSMGEVVQDIQIMQPRLDEVYRHFMHGDAL